jgi:hypothetical protein
MEIVIIGCIILVALAIIGLLYAVYKCFKQLFH